MKNAKINDRQLIRLVDKEGLTQSAIAKKLKVSRQAISKRMRELRGKKTRVVVSKKIEKAVDSGFDSMRQLLAINEKTLKLLDEAEESPELALKCVAEIRNQIKLQLDIYQTLFDMKAVAEFQEEVLQAIGECAPDVRTLIIQRLNQKRVVKSAVRYC